MNHANYKKGLQEKLVPNFESKSVIVLDNASHHNVQLNHHSTSDTRKGEKLFWLDKHGIRYSSDITKAEVCCTTATGCQPKWQLTNTGCPRRNLPDFGRVFHMLKYTDITQNTYVQSWTATEIMAREQCGLLAGPHTVPVSWQSYPFPSLSVVSYDGNSAHASHRTARVLPSVCSAVYRSVVNGW